MYLSRYILKGLYLIPHSYIIVFINTLELVWFRCIIMVLYGIWPYFPWGA